MAKVKNFKTVFPAVSVPLNDDYTINEPEFRAYLRWMKTFYNKGIQGLVCNGHTGEITGFPVRSGSVWLKSAARNAAIL